MGIHDGHRERLRDSFLETGFTGKSEHQILEIILTYAIPRKDVNPIAHQLIDQFGSLARVFDADINQLTKVPGVTRNVAVLLKLFPATIPCYYESKFNNHIKLSTIKDAKEYLIPKFASETKEVFFILCLDAHLNLIHTIRHAEGYSANASLNLPSIVASVLNAGAVQVILAHNHLSNNVEFSIQDIEATNTIATALKNIGIPVIEHFIISGSKCSTFSSLKIE